MHALRSAGALAAVAGAVALACLAGSASQGQAATQSAAAAPVLAGFATGVLQTVAGGIRDEAIAEGFNQLLGFIGLDAEETATAAQVTAIDERVQRVEAALAQANATVNETKRNVLAGRTDIDAIKDTTLRAAYSQSAQEAFDVVHHIDTALRKIEAANNAPVGARGERTRQDAENYISEYIDGAAEKLQVIVFGDPNRSVGGTPLMQTAFSVATGNDLLNHTESVHLRYQVMEYTTYESLAAAITAEYRRSRPGYGAGVDDYLQRWIATIEEQEAGRREAVPAGTVVDARHLMMWSLTPGRTRSPAAGGKITVGPFSDWAIPSGLRYESLYSGYATTPKAFLQSHGFDVNQGNVVITNERLNYSACQPGFKSLDLSVNPPTVGTLYGADLGGCKPGTHGGATEYTVCRDKAKSGRGGGTIRVCSKRTDEQQVAYNNRRFGSSDHLFFPVRAVPVGSFLPPTYRGA